MEFKDLRKNTQTDTGEDDGQRKTRTHITKEREEAPEGPAESPIKQDVNTKKVTTQRNNASTTTSQLETQGMQDVSKREVASPEEAWKIDPKVYQ